MSYKSHPPQSNVEIIFTRKIYDVVIKLFNETGRRFKTVSSNGGVVTTHMQDFIELDNILRNVEPDTWYFIHLDNSHNVNTWEKWFKKQEHVKGLHYNQEHRYFEFMRPAI